MKTVVLYGAGEFTKRFLCQPTNEYIVAAIVDRNWENIRSLMGHLVIAPSLIVNYDFDYVIISLDDLKMGNDVHIFQIYDSLVKIGIPDEKILLQSFKSQEYHINRYPRMVYVRELSELMRERNIRGSVAECGVYRGWFSAMINEFFSEESLYLFDTFSGFDTRDVESDLSPAIKAIKEGKFDHFNRTSEEIVKLRCPYRERLIFKKGYVPDTFEGVRDCFCFVNLDMDLYVPQLAALRFFAPRMVEGGVILVHDYYNNIFPGTRKAVQELAAEQSLILHPIGDGLSIALLF